MFEQAAYRKGFCTEDHLLTLTLLTEKCLEWNHPLWLGLVDFEKAFDTVEHAALWATLRKQHVPDQYVKILATLYEHQTAYVHTETDSKEFPVSRGVRQGDPISALLFIAVMEEVFRELKMKWSSADLRRTGAGFGLPVDNTKEPLTNLRFADDVLLFAQSRADVIKMTSHLAKTAAKYGLKLNYAKTKILDIHGIGTDAATVLIDGSSVEVLGPLCSERYLGRKICFGSYHETEIKNRIAAGWASFMKHKTEFCSKHCSFKLKAKLFEAVVTPRVMYGCAAWTLTDTLEKKLRVARRHMLRMMLGSRRRVRDTLPAEGSQEESQSSDEDTEALSHLSSDIDDGLEPWPDFIQRVTHQIEDLLEDTCLEDWVVLHRRRKWNFLHRTATAADERWSKRMLAWQPHGIRLVGRPCTRWSDCIEQLAGGGWLTLAEDANLWPLSVEAYAYRAGMCETFGRKSRRL